MAPSYVPPLDETLRRVLDLPREAGTPAAVKARALVAEHLQALGYDVTTQGFTFSPAALAAFPLFGAGLGWLALVVTPLLAMPQVYGWVPLLLWAIGLAGTVSLAVGAGVGWIVVGRDAATREDANLIATRGANVPIRRWIVAHLDTKAQRQSMAGRLVAVWCVIVAILVMTAAAVARLSGPISSAGAVSAAVVTILAGALAGRGRLSGTSRGARDNGTGIAALLAAAESSADPAIGFLVTGAEEFGLIGARIFAQQAPDRLRGVEVVNVDTVDQEGLLTVVVHDARGQRLGDRLLPSLEAIGLPLRTRRLPLGIFVDSAPLAQAGAQAVTIGRLTWRTLRRLHTPADTPEDLSFDAAKQVGRSLVVN